jgi:hypothetical protein
VRNSNLFEDHYLPPQVCATKSMSIIKSFKHVHENKTPRAVREDVIDIIGAWHFLMELHSGNRPWVELEGFIYFYALFLEIQSWFG